MALAHNGMIRGLNSIYLQAPLLPSSDRTIIHDFLIYCQCWSESMHHHHDMEEASFFPAIERISGSPGLMERNVEQHRAFTPGFEAFQEYAKTCNTEQYDGRQLKRLVEAFAEPLVAHLRDEIETLKALNVYDSARVRQAYKQFEKLLMDTDNVSYCVARIGAVALIRTSIVSHPLCSGLRIAASRAVYMTSRLYHSSYRM